MRRLIALKSRNGRFSPIAPPFIRAPLTVRICGKPPRSTNQPCLANCTAFLVFACRSKLPSSTLVAALAVPRNPNSIWKENMTATLLSQTGKITRPELQMIPAPPATSTHQPLPHHEIVNALLETLNFRHIEVVRDEYAISRDGMRMFGVLD